ncbi:MAG TPA: TIGR01777 family oxidoreductase [Ilumatobacteraceae bacterium]|nr:TIGR01777 family oxidoreductase [Ilumatobacteraceae bacterium]
MRIAVTGSHGLIGTALVARLRREGHEAVPVVRSTPAAGEIGWDPRAGRLDPQDLVGIDAAVNLAGAGIGDKRWTDDYKRTVLESRTRATTLLAESMAAAESGPTALLSGSAVGFYGDRGDEELDERSPAGRGFLTDVVEAWEASTAAAERAGRRVVHLRTGIVLAPDGGALAKMLPLFKLGLGGRFGSGRQWMSWIALDDEVGAIVHLLASSLSGPVNLTAPTPVRNSELTDTIGTVLHRPTVLPVPSFGPKLVLGGERAGALLLEGQRVLPRKLLSDGFEFQHPTLGGALRAVLGRAARPSG